LQEEEAQPGQEQKKRVTKIFGRRNTYLASKGRKTLSRMLLREEEVEKEKGERERAKEPLFLVYLLSKKIDMSRRNSLETRPGVNFINVFTRSFYASRFQKRKKAA